MKAFRFSLAGGVAVLAATLLLSGASSQSKLPSKIVPKLDAIAETKLIMEGLAHANFRGLERHLSVKPTEDQTWVFARGQALLIAETANLLMLRPPKKEGQDTWFLRAMELRGKAADLAKAVSSKDFTLSRQGLMDLGAACTRCHKNFDVPILIEPFTDPPPAKVE